MIDKKFENCAIYLEDFVCHIVDYICVCTSDVLNFMLIITSVKNRHLTVISVTTFRFNIQFLFPFLSIVYKSIVFFFSFYFLN